MQHLGLEYESELTQSLFVSNFPPNYFHCFYVLLHWVNMRSQYVAVPVGLFACLLWAAGGRIHHKTWCGWTNHCWDMQWNKILSCPCKWNFKPLSPVCHPFFFSPDGETQLWLNWGNWGDYHICVFEPKPRFNFNKSLFWIKSVHRIPLSAADCCDAYWYVVSGRTVKEPQESWCDVGSTTSYSFLHLLSPTWICGLSYEMFSGPFLLLPRVKFEGRPCEISIICKRLSGRVRQGLI